MPGHTKSLFPEPEHRPVIHWRRHQQARRISLRLDPLDGSVIVTLPPRATRASGQAWLDANAAWIAHQRARLPVAPRLVDGAAVPFEGVPITIRHCPNHRRSACLVDNVLTVGGAPDHIPTYVLTFLKYEARQRLGRALQAWSDVMAVAPAAFALRDTRSRWGSCTTTGRIMLNWRLIMAPVIVRDYVVIHELAHLTHFDHSAAFWALVDRFTPHRTKATTWLRKNGRLLLSIGHATAAFSTPEGICATAEPC